MAQLGGSALRDEVVSWRDKQTGAQGASGSLARSLTAGVVLFAGKACYVMS